MVDPEAPQYPRPNMVRYVERAAAHSAGDAYHWYRYLRKFTTDEGTELLEHEMETLKNSDALDIFQKAALIASASAGCSFNAAITGLNKRCTERPGLKLVFERLREQGTISDEDFEKFKVKFKF